MPVLGVISKFVIGLAVISTPLTMLGQSKPDLVVSSMHIDPDPGGSFVTRVRVTVLNACRGSGTNASFVMVTFKENSQPGSKAIYFVGSRVNALNGGESQTLTFDAAASGKQIGMDRYVLVEVDPYRKIAEASEDNNWRTKNPDADAGAPQCKTGK